ncbi:hypothetical protein HSB1_27980 [Halogranum salarium B-1]|uniref:Uncharacterized protein n=1 Tax=Halogranum salarium B-1 TaxID=1210908 RepID=J3EWR1_9EURY|nr:hypothetical protein HSB1_27980 [Halogranum salarium B-1]
MTDKPVGVRRQRPDLALSLSGLVAVGPSLGVEAWGQRSPEQAKNQPATS